MQSETWHSPVGLTHDAGWELDVRRTLPAPTSETWQRLLAEWLPQWLGVESVPQMVGAPVRRGGRVHGRVIGCHVGRRVRLRWTPETLDHETVFQVTLQEVPESLGHATILEIHQERLLGVAERQGLLDHWNLVLDDVVAAHGRELAMGRLDLQG
ncbi:hypothetical protein [Brachybacterium atlanticum]|uniref:hypothetical protein n=1 Tax=Brachybacterium atlanticum TaxID=2911888 RepID=UPI0021E0A380|nr:hypothetical protein [Brachybacterium atlanticum]